MNIKSTILTGMALMAGALSVPAAAETSMYSTRGVYQVAMTTEHKMCGLGTVDANGSNIMIAYNAATETTTFAINHPDFGDLSKYSNVPVYFVLDDQILEWTGEGGKDAIYISVPDSRVPAALINAKDFAIVLGDGNTVLMYVASDTDFEAAMRDTVHCARKVIK